MTDRLARYLAVLRLNDDGGACLRSGQFHDVVLVGGVAYRFPKDEASRRNLPAACALLAALGDCGLSPAIPRLLDSDHLDCPLGRSYAAVSLLPGTPLAGELSQRAQDAVAIQLAELLDRLAEAGSDETIRRIVPSEGAAFWTSFADQVRQVLYPLMSAAGRRRADAELTAVSNLVPGQPARAPGQPARVHSACAHSALVHSDLGGDNLLWLGEDGVPRLTGILDWDGAVIGNQASDLASIAVTVGWPLAERIDGLRRSGPPAIGDARVISATFALQQALPAALSNDRANLDDGLTGYR